MLSIPLRVGRIHCEALASDSIEGETNLVKLHLRRDFESPKICSATARIKYIALISYKMKH